VPFDDCLGLRNPLVAYESTDFVDSLFQELINGFMGRNVLRMSEQTQTGVFAIRFYVQRTISCCVEHYFS